MWMTPWEGAIHQRMSSSRCFHLVDSVGGLRQRGEEGLIVAVDQLADLVLAQCVVVGLLVGGVCLGVEHYLVGALSRAPKRTTVSMENSRRAVLASRNAAA